MTLILVCLVTFHLKKPDNITTRRRHLQDWNFGRGKNWMNKRAREHFGQLIINTIPPVSHSLFELCDSAQLLPDEVSVTYL